MAHPSDGGRLLKRFSSALFRSIGNVNTEPKVVKMSMGVKNNSISDKLSVCRLTNWTCFICLFILQLQTTDIVPHWRRDHKAVKYVDNTSILRPSRLSASSLFYLLKYNHEINCRPYLPSVLHVTCTFFVDIANFEVEIRYFKIQHIKIKKINPRCRTHYTSWSKFC